MSWWRRFLSSSFTKGEGEKGEKITSAFSIGYILQGACIDKGVWRDAIAVQAGCSGLCIKCRAQVFGTHVAKGKNLTCYNGFFAFWTDRDGEETISNNSNKLFSVIEKNITTDTDRIPGRAKFTAPWPPHITKQGLL